MIFINILTIGLGGAGVNIVKNMVDNGNMLTDYYIFDTDCCPLKISKFGDNHKLLVGEEVRVGHTCGADPDQGYKSIISSTNDIKNIISNYEIIILVCGLGAGLGSGGAPEIVRIAKELGKQIYPIYELPFKFEGPVRFENAKIALEKTMFYTKNIIVFRVYEEMEISSMLKIFKMKDDIFRYIHNVLVSHLLSLNNSFDIVNLIEEIIESFDDELINNIKKFFYQIEFYNLNDYLKIIIDSKSMERRIVREVDSKFLSY